jgi:hypothetical protein
MTTPWNPESLAHCTDDELVTLLDHARWEAFSPPRDLPALRARLERLEQDRGVTDLHRRVSARVAAGAELVVAARHVGAIGAFALSPCGRYLVTGSDTPAHDYAAGGELVVWEAAAGRALRAFHRVEGGVGWTDHASCLQWSPSGSLVGAAFNTNGVGAFDPFAEEPFACEAYVTNGRDTPPAFCFSPEGDRLFIAAWGPHDEVGCVLPVTPGESVDHESDALRWLSGAVATGEGKGAGQSAGESAEESEDDDEDDDEDGDDDGTLGCYQEVRWSSRGQLQGHTGSRVYALDAATGQLAYALPLHAPLAWSADGARMAQGHELLAIHDGATGGPRAMPMLMGAEALVFAPDGRRLAMVVRAGNAFKADAGVHILEDGVVRQSLDVAVASLGGSASADASPLSFSRAGEELACLTEAGTLEIWSLGGTPARRLTIPDVGPIDGLAWAAGDTLIGVGRNAVAFWDATTGARRACHRMLPPPGFAPPAPDQSPYEGREGVLALAGDRGFEWAIADAGGDVVCPPHARAALAPLASFVLADNRLAWPWAWAVGTALTRVYADASEVPATSPLAGLRTTPRESAGAPFVTIEVGDPPPRGAAGWELERHQQRQALCVAEDLLSYELNTSPVTCYRASPCLVGSAIRREALAGFVGKVVLWACQAWPEQVEIGVMSSLHGSYFMQRCERRGGFSAGSVQLDDLGWIGLAVPLG